MTKDSVPHTLDVGVTRLLENLEKITTHALSEENLPKTVALVENLERLQAGESLFVVGPLEREEP